MKCRKCGHKNKKTSQYCIACGEPLEGESKGKSNLTYILLVIVILLIAAVGVLSVNSGLFNNNDAPIENMTNDTQSTSENNLTNEVQSDSIEDNDTNAETEESTTKTINEQDSEVIEIYGVPFTVPTGGNYRTECTYQFKFNGHLCEVEEVEHYETSDSQRTFSTWNPSNYYPGGESYVLTVNNHVWKGIKIEKDDRWYHISMRSNDDDEVEEMLNWMYEKNTWVNH